MDITFISDTHGLHHRVKLNGGTILIHSGDLTEFGTEEEFADFLDWFTRQPYLYKIFIAGNHDLCLETMTKIKKGKLIPSNLIYLQNSGIEIEGFRIWGSPVTPYSLGMAFNARSGKEIQRIWQKIPPCTDILITHGPPQGILDCGMGDEDLSNQVKNVQPKIHCFGHIHGQIGSEKINGTTFVNASMVNSPDFLKSANYMMVGKPITINL